MAILGRLDAKTFANNVGVTINSATVTKNAADEIDQGDIIELGGVAYLVKQVNSTTQITLHTDYAGTTNTALAGAIRRTAPKAVAEYIIKGADSASYELVFVDATEQAVSTNKSRGIWGPGWWKYRTYTDASGNTRHKAECIAALQATTAVAGDDVDETIVADVVASVTITLQPADQTGLADPATVNIATAVSTSPGGAGVFQWQKQTPTGTRWTNVTDAGVYSGSTSSTLSLTGIDKATFDGYKFRVKVTSDLGAPEVISDTATLTFA